MRKKHKLLYEFIEQYICFPRADENGVYPGKTTLLTDYALERYERMKRKAIDVYVVLVLNAFNNAKVSQEAYTSLAAAQEFCKGRADKPEQLTRYCFKSKVYTYQIYWTTLVLNCGG